MAKRSSVLAALLAVACGGSASNRPPPEKPETVTVAQPTAENQLAVAPQPPTARSAGAGYALSPLTDLARAMQDVVVAALEGRDPSLGTIPIERIRNMDRLVRSKGTVPPVRELEFIAFAMEVRMVLSRSDSSSGGDADDIRAIECVAFLSRTGLKLAQIRTRGDRETKPLPAWLSGVEQFGSSVFQALRNHTTRSLLIGVEERPLLGEELYREAEKELRRVDLAPLEKAAAKRAAPLGYSLDDVILLARDSAGGVWGFQLQMDEEDGRIVLDSSPLVRVEKFEPKPEPEPLEPVP